MVKRVLLALFSNRFYFTKILITFLVLNVLSLYMFQEGEKREVTFSKCTENPFYKNSLWETTLNFSEKKGNLYFSTYERDLLSVYSESNLPLNVNIRVLLKCSTVKQNMELIKYEILGDKRLMKIGISLVGLIVPVLLFFNVFKLKPEKNSFFQIK